MPGAEQADQLMQPETERLLGVEVSPEELAGTFSVQLKVNPDLPYDRQILVQLGTQLMPILQPVYPIGARLLMKRIWEMHGQTRFDELYPPAIAMMQTQILFQQVMAQLQGAGQPLQEPPQPPPPGSDPKTQQALEAAMQAQAGADTHSAVAQGHKAQHEMMREHIKTGGEYAKLMEQLHKATMNAAQGGKNGGE